ncbi:serine hydrolase domain-containing protein [Lichenicola sp.]|uniref:serine hydrolase domain-containing protein n=1 Tax=Lichenicola sp. TaxID=2804529 RepID=UPI003B006309
MQATAFIGDEGGLVASGIAGPVPWWSFTKTVLATAALRLVEDGLLQLDGPVEGERFSLRQLLRHEAGLPDYGALPDYHRDVAAGAAPWPIERLLAAVDVERWHSEPGEGWAYSNIGYLKVSQLIERASGLPLQAALDRLVFQPARIATARLATLPADLEGVQMGAVENYDPGWVFHGLIVGTVADAAGLLRALMNGDLLGPAMLAEMLRGRALPEYRGEHPDPAYGLGIMLWANDPLDHPLGHRGEGPGSRIAVLARGTRAAAVWTALPSRLDAEAHAVALLA